MKKAVLVLFVMIQFATTIGVASGSAPWPVCLPCKGVVVGR